MSESIIVTPRQRPGGWELSGGSDHTVRVHDLCDAEKQVRALLTDADSQNDDEHVTILITIDQSVAAAASNLDTIYAEREDLMQRLQKI